MNAEPGKSIFAEDLVVLAPRNATTTAKKAKATAQEQTVEADYSNVRYIENEELVQLYMIDFDLQGQTHLRPSSTSLTFKVKLALKFTVNIIIYINQLSV